MIIQILRPLIKFLVWILVLIRSAPLIIIIPCYMFFRFLVMIILVDKYEDVKDMVREVWHI
jgi:hypothetical protein